MFHCKTVASLGSKQLRREASRDPWWHCPIEPDKAYMHGYVTIIHGRGNKYWGINTDTNRRRSKGFYSPIFTEPDVNNCLVWFSIITWVLGVKSLQR